MYQLEKTRNKIFNLILMFNFCKWNESKLISFLCKKVHLVEKQCTLLDVRCENSTSFTTTENLNIKLISLAAVQFSQTSRERVEWEKTNYWEMNIAKRLLRNFSCVFDVKYFCNFIKLMIRSYTKFRVALASKFLMLREIHSC